MTMFYLCNKILIREGSTKKNVFTFVLILTSVSMLKL